MTSLKSEYNDKEILEKAAEVEAEKRPFEYEVSGVEWTDIAGDFSYEDFGNPPTIMVPNRLNQLENNGYLNEVYPSGSSANTTYRLTRHGWNIVNQDEPDDSIVERHD